ncbi:hypothetical protein [Vibrio gangliei]|uniref:hypothetical protein n=1 Tax=Vibrio gangliei TaxID=2077090 RepID=UPI000D011D1D|nr:hypothetical protein [Vibrio gangliei]
MTRRNKNNKQKAAKREIPNSLAYSVVAVAACAIVYFTFFNDTSISNPFAKSAPRSTQTAQAGGSGQTVIKKVEAPDAANAPQLMLPSIDSLGIYRSEQIHRNLLIANENQKAQLEEARLKTDTASFKRQTIASSSNDSDYGVSSSTPVRVATEPPAVIEPAQPSSYESGVSQDGQISLISISKINNELEAMITYNGEVVSLNLQGIVYSSSKDIPRIAVTQLDDQSLCVKQNSKNQCFKVY